MKMNNRSELQLTLTLILTWPEACFRNASMVQKITGMSLFRYAWEFAGGCGVLMILCTILLLVGQPLAALIPGIMYLIPGCLIALVAHEDRVW